MKTSLKLKNKIVILGLVFAISSISNLAWSRDLKINFSFKGPNQSDRAEIVISHKGNNLGALTVEALDFLTIPYNGNARGIHSIFNTPVGNDAIEIISREEMKAYGWCFTLNGLLEEVYPDEIEIDEDKINVDWYYGYAHYLSGEWIGQCIPAF